MFIDINCDLGEVESINDTAYYDKIMPHISSVNVACAFHAGTPAVMAKTVELALKYNVAIGVHPGFYDRENFGRTVKTISDDEFIWQIRYQIGALREIVNAYGAELNHIKLHGALYNMTCADAKRSKLLLDILESMKMPLTLYALSGSELHQQAKARNYPVKAEVFADRNYLANGQLVPRSQENAVKHDAKDMINHALLMVKHNKCQAVDGQMINLEADTICIHGDHAESQHFASQLKKALNDENVQISAQN